MALSLTCKKLFRLSVSSRCIFRTCSTSYTEKKGLVLGVYDDDRNGLELTPAAQKYNQICQGKLLEQLQLAGNKVKEGKSLLFFGLGKDFNSVAVVGLGKKSKTVDELEQISEEKESIRIAAAAGCRALNSAGIKEISVESLGDAEAAAEGGHLGTWKFQEYKTKKEAPPSLRLYETAKEDAAKWHRGAIKAGAQNTARRLADAPANLMTPSIFAENARQLLQSLEVEVAVRDKQWAEKERMGCFLAVARGSAEPPRFLELSYGEGERPFVLVGKGVTFDSGGISIKSSAKMDAMRADMSGAACVLSAVSALASLRVPAAVKALIPLTENMPGGAATKPGDVVVARNGKSVCVNNTDAEGRLILADALCYSEVFKPRWVLDVATLTGAVVVALGAGAATGVFSNSDGLYEGLREAGASTGDRVWRLPLWKFYSKQVTDQDGYDVNNIASGFGGGSCTAAAFLREFVPEKTDWLHLDIAAVMGPDDKTPYLGKGMTGRPTRTLIEFIEAQAKKG